MAHRVIESGHCRLFSSGLSDLFLINVCAPVCGSLQDGFLVLRLSLVQSLSIISKAGFLLDAAHLCNGHPRDGEANLRSAIAVRWGMRLPLRPSRSFWLWCLTKCRLGSVFSSVNCHSVASLFIGALHRCLYG